ncbi:MAG TPA: SRPBCC domain-containing protein [Candidatus Krumholzibacteria bacterium]|nr:SRPBCC domain-containing protein [Candidatus Krumholzibacteria bacterium]HPD71780.1 SRPBCC domain-containing protein [Candidatus Krumholzibacteria bacterium]HRY41287.1 SRPBCC domain-containing protein [Candidatus Krumholzibacteria bacterium]
MKPGSRTLEVTKQIDVEAPIDHVWAAITQPSELARWFPEAIESGPLAPGTRGWLTWKAYGRFAFAVESAEAPRHLVWRWSHEAGREIDAGPTTRVEWTLETRPDGGTRVTVRETGFLTEKHLGENTEGWDHELGELVALLGG